MIRNIKQFLFIAGLLLIAAGAQPVGAAIWQWSTTAATNATADPSINWAEGMAPSAVNDSARAMMAAIAANNKDDGQLSSGGTTTVITLTTNTGYSTLAQINGQKLTFRHTLAGNADAAQISIDSLGGVPIYLGSAPITANSLLQDGVYTIVCLSSTSHCHMVDRYQDPYNTPLGGIIWSTLTTAPNANFAAPYGQCISATTYVTYWVALGSPASGSCPGGQFAIIDLRGRVAAGLDQMPGSTAATRLTSGGTCGASMNNAGSTCVTGQNQVLTTANLPPYTPAGSVTAVTVTSTRSDIGIYNSQAGLAAGGNSVASMAAAGFSITSTGSGSFSGSAQGGTSTPISTVQPTMALMPWLRIL